MIAAASLEGKQQHTLQQVKKRSRSPAGISHALAWPQSSRPLGLVKQAHLLKTLGPCSRAPHHEGPVNHEVLEKGQLQRQGAL
jgi:hypothetical protein